AESDDGKYLYVVLRGALSLTRYDLTTGQVGAIFPINPPNTFYGQVAPRGVAVLPGSHDSVGLDLGSYFGTGIFDVSGNSAAFRSKFTGIYTGSSIAFPT